MKLIFQAGEQPFEVVVEKDRSISMRGSMTNDQWVSYEELLQESGQDEKAEAEIASLIIKGLREDSDLEKYLIYEFTKNPLIEHVKTIK